MATTPVSDWDLKALLVSEATFGTVPNPALGQALKLIDLDMGPMESGVIRPQKDRNALGRGMTSAYLAGRVPPMGWSLATSIKGRSAIDVAAQEDVLYAAAGLKKTLNSSTSAVYSLVSTPGESADFKSMTLGRILGTANVPNLGSVYLEEVLRGCLCQSLSWKGGDSEVILSAKGVGIGKYMQGQADSLSVADSVTTSVTITAEESYRLGLGWYQWENEIIKVTAITPGATTMTIARAQLSSSGAAHSSKPLQPYIPASITYSGTPVMETTGSVTIGGVSFRMRNWQIDFASGMDLLPGEVGSAYVQGYSTKRYDWKVSCTSVLHASDVSLLGKSTAKANVAITIVQGTGTGGIMTFSLPYCELIAAPAPAPGNQGYVQVKLDFRARDNSGNDACTLTLT